MSDHRTPAYPSKSTLAHELDCAESTVDELVKRGVLPKPIRLTGGCVRWIWEDVVVALTSLKDGTGGDPYSAGVAKLGESENGEKGKGRG
jgi:predicted DNA-binding transcriptional regulator AlpA